MAADSPFSVVPYSGGNSFKRVRIRHDGLIRTMLRHLGALDFVIVLGPPRHEKTHLLRDVLGEIEAGGQADGIYVDLWQSRADDETTFFASLAQLMAAAPGAALPISDAAGLSSRAFQNYLLTCLQQRTRHLVLLIDHLQSIPQDLVYSLLVALRSAYNEQMTQPTPRLVVVMTGGMNLVGLASGPTSPFNIAKPLLMPGLTPPQGLKLAAATLAAYGTHASEKALELLIEQAGGDTYLLPQLCAWCAEAVRGYQRPQVTTSVVTRAVQRLWLTFEAQAPLREAIQLVEEDPDTLLDVLDIIQNGELPQRQARQPLTRTGAGRLQLCGALQVSQGAYRFKNEIYRRGLSEHWQPAQVGHVLRMTGRWREAINYLGMRLAANPRPQARTDLLEAIIQSIYAVDDLKEAYAALVQGLELGFGLSQVHVYRADPARSELRLMSLSHDAQSAAEHINLNDAAVESVEARTFRTGDYALRRTTAAEVRLVAALVPEQQPIGLVTIENYQAGNHRHGLPPELPELLRFLRHAAGAIENVTVRNAYQEIGQAVLNADSLSPTFDRVLQAVCNALGCDFANLYLLDNSNTVIAMAAGVGRLWKPEWQAQAQFERSGQHPAARCLRLARAVTAHSDDRGLNPAIVHRFGLRPYLRVFAPLAAAGSQLGVLEVGFHSKQKQLISEEDRRNLGGFADQVAIAVYNGQLLRRTDEALTRQVEELRQLRDVSLVVSSTLDLNKVLSQVIDQVRTVFGAQEVTIWKYLPHEEALIILQSTIDDASYIAQRLRLDSVTGQAVTSRHAQHVRDIQTAPRGRPHSQVRERGLHGMLSMPLISRDAVLGALNLYTTAAQSFGPEAESLLPAFAAQAALAIDNAQQYQELQAANRHLDAVRERDYYNLIHAVAHRLINTLGDVPHHLQLIRQRATSGQPFDGPLARIEQRMRTLGDLLEPLQMVLELEHIQKEWLDLGELIEGICRRLPSSDIELELDLPPTPTWINASRVLLLDAIQSVVDNACEALAGRGRLAVRLHAAGEPSIELRITDNGPGMAEEVLSRAFEPYYSTKTEAEHGRGRGLFTCRQFIQKHGGTVGLTSEVGVGTTCIIKLPASS